MERSTNALAELAERITDVLAFAQDELFLEHKQTLDKAQRIVAELAKLQFDANGKPNMYDAFHCSIDCRAIAEEGAKDESK